jgi:hypothetical protein
VGVRHEGVSIMTRRKIIQIQASVIEPIAVIANDARRTVSEICLGIDDMQLLGNKALVLRAEIYPEKLQALFAALVSIGIRLNKQSLPEIGTLQEEIEHPITIQITSLSGDTDRSVKIPNVPG